MRKVETLLDRPAGGRQKIPRNGLLAKLSVGPITPRKLARCRLIVIDPVVSGAFVSILAMQEVTSPSPYTLELNGLHPGAYEVHAIVKYPSVTIDGSTYRFIYS
jgi:hypothetical protein